MPQLANESDRLRRVFQAYADAGLPESKWSLRNRGNLAIQREIMSALVDLLARAGMPSLENRRALEIGCGDGRVLEQLISLGANPRLIAGIDLLEERVEVARRRLPEAELRVADARSLPYPDESFDLVLAFTVFSSILELEFARQVAHEMRRVLKPGGAVVHYDFIYDNPWNANVRGVKRAEVEGYFEGYRGYWKQLTLFPPLARRLGILTPVVYPVLAALPVLRTHLMGVLRKSRK
ncbi:MAG: class I SAM-dependent methyltransferase [Limisphaerales bacterium]